jgi:hypothetical protein
MLTFGRTVGGCVWSAEDLEKDPSAWEHREVPWNPEMTHENWWDKVAPIIYQVGEHHSNNHGFW